MIFSALKSLCGLLRGLNINLEMLLIYTWRANPISGVMKICNPEWKDGDHLGQGLGTLYFTFISHASPDPPRAHRLAELCFRQYFITGPESTSNISHFTPNYHGYSFRGRWSEGFTRRSPNHYRIGMHWREQSYPPEPGFQGGLQMVRMSSDSGFISLADTPASTGQPMAYTIRSLFNRRQKLTSSLHFPMVVPSSTSLNMYGC